MMLAALLFSGVLCALLPSHLVVAGLLGLWAGMRAVLPTDTTIVAVGPVDLLPSDVIMLLLGAKFVLTAIHARELPVHGALYAAVGVFLVVNLVASLVAGIKFGQPQLLRCGAAWARLISEVMLIPIAAQAVRTLPQARHCIYILLATLVALAAIQFINYFGASHGIVVGEVQGAERGELRYFGPIGDSIGVVLLLGYVAALCFANLAGAALFLGGILLTGGLGAIFGVAVATGLFLVFGTRGEAVRQFLAGRLWLLPMLAFIGIAAVFIWAKPLTRTLGDRLGSGSYAESGSQRLTSAKLACTMILDNPLLGVGFMGYEPALGRYDGARYFDLDRPDGAQANANNQFLQSLADAGVVGLLAFGTLGFCAARLFLHIATRGGDPPVSTFFLAAFLWLLTQVFGNLAAVWLVPSSFVARLLWISLGLAVAVERLLPELHPAVSAKPPLNVSSAQLKPA